MTDCTLCVPPSKPSWDDNTFPKLLRIFLNPFDGRFEDLWLPGTSLPRQVFQDFVAGLIIATIAIPIAMGFAIASGLHPVQGIVGGAVAGGVGALLGGSKYQVYGPTAAFIPLIACMIHEFGGGDPANFYFAHGCMVFCSVVAGVIIICMGLLRLGSYVQLVPHSIIVGFTIGIAGAILMSELVDILGVQSKVRGPALEKLVDVVSYRSEFNGYCLFISAMTFVMIKACARVSVFIPGPIVAIAVGIALTEYVWQDKGIVRVVDKFGAIPTELLRFTPPIVPSLSYLPLVVKAVFSIVFVSAIESLLCSKLADSLAGNDRLPFHPNKEMWGQGWVQILVPMLNGFPHTGALARTATNIKVGAVSPLAGFIKCVLKLALAYMTTPVLNIIPMACVGGILTYVAVNMVKFEEVLHVVHSKEKGAVAVMVVTAAVVFVKDFLSGILAGLVLYLALSLIFSAQSQAKLDIDISDAQDTAVEVVSDESAALEGRRLVGDVLHPGYSNRV